jgi:hypothetical protein
VKVFRIIYTIDEELTEEQIWPDGDGPENATADDVRDLMDDDVHETLRDWNLDHRSVTVREVKS